MKVQSTRAAGVAELARKFRYRAAEATDQAYRDLMLRTAYELEELVDRLIRDKESEAVIPDDPKIDITV